MNKDKQAVTITITPDDDRNARALHAVNQCRELLAPHLEAFLWLDEDKNITSVLRTLRSMAASLQQRIAEDSQMNVSVPEDEE